MPSIDVNQLKRRPHSENEKVSYGNDSLLFSFICKLVALLDNVSCLNFYVHEGVLDRN